MQPQPLKYPFDYSSTASPWRRVTLLCGALFGVVLIADGVLFPKPPDIAAGAEQYVEYYTANAAGVLANVYAVALAMLLFVLFLGGLRAVLQSGEREVGPLPTAVFGAGVVMATLVTVGWLVEGSIVGLAQRGVDPRLIAGLDGVAPYSLALSSLARAAVLVGSSFLLLRRQLAAGWIGWVGVVLGVLTLLGSVTALAVGPSPLFAVTLGSFMLFGLWAIALSVALLRRPVAGRSAVLEPGPAA